MDPMVSLVRRWAVEWIAAADPSVCAEILAPEYQILIGGYVLGPRERYIEGTVEQLDRFPGLGLTVHELIRSEGRLAVRFTEHGASVKLDDRAAAWGGIALFRWNGEQLTECFAEEDYLARRRQLAGGRCDPIDRPSPAPWNATHVEPDPEAEAVVRAWLATGGFAGAELDDAWLGRPAPLLLDDPETELTELFSAGPRVAFHGLQRGRYAGGLEGIDAAPGSEAAHHLVGLVTVADARVSEGRVIRDRLGMQRALAGART